MEYMSIQRNVVNACYYISAFISSVFGRLLHVLIEPLLIVFLTNARPSSPRRRKALGTRLVWYDGIPGITMTTNLTHEMDTLEIFPVIVVFKTLC